jgi:transcriptional regulator with XRE-family HTH domain
MPVTLAEMMKDLSPAKRAEVERGAQEILVQHRTLADLRRALKVTQVDLADALETSQANIAQIESKKDVMVSTLTRVVEALGGSLKMVVTIPGHGETILQIGQSGGEPRLKKAVTRKERPSLAVSRTEADRLEQRRRA